MTRLRVLLVTLLVVLVGAVSSAPGRAGQPAPGAAPAPLDVASLLNQTPADSLPVPLAALESSRPPQAAQAALAAGALHYARGEYRAAIDAYGRAAARLEPARKDEARYWIGISWLALGEPAQARASLEEVARTPSAKRPDAMLGVADCWLALHRPDRAAEWLAQATEAGVGERTPALLEREAALAERAGHPQPARDALERIAREWPRSIEAASARVALAAGGPAATDGPLTVVVGSFLDPARARSLANEARRSGFPNAEVVTRGEGLAAVHEVRLGNFSEARQAESAGQQAGRALGVAWQVVKAR